MSELTDSEQIYLEAIRAWHVGDFTRAVALTRPGAQRGNSDYQNLLGMAYGEGLGVEKSFSKSMHWYRRAWATEPRSFLCGNIAAIYNKSGNRKAAEIWWRRALSMGDVHAALPLARLLLQTRRRRDIVRAMALLRLITTRRNWHCVNVATREEAHHLLRQLQKSWRAVLHQH